MFEAMEFSSIPDFLNMGGHAFYVWSVYGLFFVFIAANLILPMRNRKKILREQKRRLIIDEEMKR